MVELQNMGDLNQQGLLELVNVESVIVDGGQEGQNNQR